MVIRFASMVFVAVGISLVTFLALVVCLVTHVQYPNLRIMAIGTIFLMGAGYGFAYWKELLLTQVVTIFFAGVGGCALFLIALNDGVTWDNSFPVLAGGTFWFAGAVGSCISAEQWLISHRERAVHSAH